MNQTRRLNYYFQDNLVLGETAHSIVITIYCILVTAAGEGFVSGDLVGTEITYNLINKIHIVMKIVFDTSCTLIHLTKQGIGILLADEDD